jgi:hypothetical protein
MKSTILLFLSVGLNIPLVGITVHWLRTPLDVVPPTAAHSAGDRRRARPTADAQALAPVFFVTNRFHWRELESTNYEQFVANLRTVGCPEKTVRDIILADVNKLYAARRRALEHQDAFWLAGNERRKARLVHDRELAVLASEREALLCHLLGTDQFTPLSSFLDSFEEQALSRFILGPMPDETFERVARLLHKYELLEREVNRRCDGIRLEEDDARLKSLEHQVERELAAVLAPAQMEELMARAAMVNLFGPNPEFDGVDLAPFELRQIAVAKSAMESPFRSMLGGSTDDGTDAERKARQEQFRAAVKDVLGEARYADFERAQDGEFRTLYELGKKNNLPQNAAVQVYEIRKLSRDDMERLRLDPALDPPARRQRLDEMQATIQQEVLRALGAEGCQEYLRRGGGWITNWNAL